MWNLGPWPGTEPRAPALGARSLTHWTTKGVPVHGPFLNSVTTTFLLDSFYTSLVVHCYFISEPFQLLSITCSFFLTKTVKIAYMSELLNKSIKLVFCWWIFHDYWQLPQISTGDETLDLVVIGCGPAGLALAAELAKLGLNVGLIGPDLPFTNNYGVWEDEFNGISFWHSIFLYKT